LRVIRNGVDISRFNTNESYEAVRRSFAEPSEKIVLFVGRLVYEKGVHVLLGAAPKVLSALPNVKFVIVGEGGMKEQLLNEAWNFGIAEKVFFTGFVDEKTLILLYRASNVAVIPSLYEPFGITALEAMAAKVPVVTSDVGGLTEIVEHDRTGVKVFPGSPDSLAWGITRVLTDPQYADWIKTNAYEEVLKEYTWKKIGEKTKILYQWVYDEYEMGSWKPT
jgi:glycogen(starch) synthase